MVKTYYNHGVHEATLQKRKKEIAKVIEFVCVSKLMKQMKPRYSLNQHTLIFLKIDSVFCNFSLTKILNPKVV